MNRTTAVVIAALVAVLAAIGLLSGEADEAAAPGEPPAQRVEPLAQRVEPVAQRVERLRELKFEHLPRVRRVTGEQARGAALRELDREIPRADVLAEERLLKLLELIPPESSLRELLGEAIGSEVGGYYLPRTGTLSIVGGGGQLGLLGEVTLAHELTHALEDQHFGLESRGSTGFRRDRAMADSALREGTATVAMVDYAVLQQAGKAKIPARLRARALRQLDDVAVPASTGLPRYMREGLVFPYAAGAQLVNRIQGRGGWKAVNRAFGAGAPVSSEQVMHPHKYDARERPVPVRVRGGRGALPPDARLVEEGAFGEFDTAQLLREANGRARSGQAAAGWGGAAFALWRLSGGECEEPCRERYALVLRWAWDRERDAHEFERAARRTARALSGASVTRRGQAVAL
nr:hypothetical protein [Thermoleophilaceae bacterium]